jgi:hypothetical protein
MAAYECPFCLHEFQTVTESPDGTSPEFNPEVFFHIREFHPDKWKLVRQTEAWVRRMPIREVREIDLATDVEPQVVFLLETRRKITL